MRKTDDFDIVADFSGPGVEAGRLDLGYMRDWAERLGIAELLDGR